MILAHPLIGFLLGQHFGYTAFWVTGSVLPDIDHLALLAKHNIYNPRKIIHVLRFEKQYNISFKTKYLHSLLGAVIISTPLALFDLTGSFYFFIAYLLHLLMDWPDIDEKQFLFPLKKTFRGTLPIFSLPEIIFTLLILLLILL